MALKWERERFEVTQRDVAGASEDNIAGHSFADRMCLPQPIDVVYTWVNGSDPQLLADLAAVCDSYAFFFVASDMPHS